MLPMAIPPDTQAIAFDLSFDRDAVDAYALRRLTFPVTKNIMKGLLVLEKCWFCKLYQIQLQQPILRTSWRKDDKPTSIAYSSRQYFQKPWWWIRRSLEIWLGLFCCSSNRITGRKCIGWSCRQQQQFQNYFVSSRVAAENIYWKISNKKTNSTVSI